MTTEHYNFYVFSYHHNGSPNTKWQTTLSCAEKISEFYHTIHLFDSCTINMSHIPDLTNEDVHVYLIRCVTPEEREHRLKLCTLIIELFNQISFPNPIPTFAWRCARTPEVNLSNFPQCFRTSKEISLFLQPLMELTLKLSFL